MMETESNLGNDNPNYMDERKAATENSIKGYRNQCTKTNTDFWFQRTIKGIRKKQIQKKEGGGNI